MGTSGQTEVEFWDIKPELLGRSVVVVGGGPSLELIDLEPLRGKYTVVGINNAYQKAPWCEYLFFADDRWAGWHEQYLHDYKGVLITSHGKDLPASLRSRVRRVRHDKTPRFMYTSPDVINPDLNTISGADSGAQAIDLAIHMGAIRVILLGFDMRFKKGRAHWHPDHPIKTVDTLYARRYLPQHIKIKEAANDRGIAILNATEGSAIDCYPRVTFDELTKAPWSNKIPPTQRKGVHHV
jgi:hypothetical protein